jgi:hypothetical protein
MRDMEVMEMLQLLEISLSRNIKQLKTISNKHVKTFGDIKDYNYKMMLVGERKQNTYKMKKNSILTPLSPYKK